MKHLLFIPFLIFWGCANKPASDKERSLFNKASIEKYLVVNKSTQKEVVDTFGMPEIINSDADKNEQWVYSKKHSEVNSKGVGAGAMAFFLSNVPLITDVSGHSDSTSRTEETVTVTLDFNQEGILTHYNYGKTKF